MESTPKSLEDQLADAKKELQQFVYAAGHDLQEPLRTITTYTQLLERHYSADERAREFISFVIGGVNRMNTLLESLLVYSRIGSSNERTEVKLSSSLHWALLKLSDAIKETEATIQHDELPEIYANEIQMAQLFENILNNSLKFRGKDKPQVAIRAEEGSGEYEFSIRDNGIGIDPRFHQQVFVPFKRLHGKDVSGSGLGLAICERIVAMHGGRIWIDSDGQHGTTVKFTLPV
jgi:light-regulated signal transduction histidine kinase (bacteriophytochrome)